MDFYNFLIGLMLLLIASISFILGQRLPEAKHDEFLSRTRVYVLSATLFLIVNLLHLTGQ